MKKHLTAIVFYGAMWGVFEASLGYILHSFVITTNFTGMVMFPLACYFMLKVYQQTDNVESVFLTSTIAASIKLVDLFIVAIPLDRVLHPALCILLEGAVVYAVFKVLEGQIAKINYVQTLALCMSWRALYIIHLYFVAFLYLKLPPVSIMLKRFFLIESLGNSAVIYLFIKATAKLSKFQNINKYALMPRISFSMLALAIFIQILVK